MNIADFFVVASPLSPHGMAHGALYVDGMIIYLGVSEKLHETFLKVIDGVSHLQPETWQRSGDGAVYAYLFRGDPDELELILGGALTAIGQLLVPGNWSNMALSDNRDKDVNRLDAFIDMLAPLPDPVEN
ncbi:MAG: hypothetical protein KGL39_00445 [Patescibacteria group bacterium]|nr:hypothetical protein [Patescibacteria group bacterium]